MPAAVDIQQLLKLSAESRLKLISIIWDSLEQESDEVPINEEALNEAERRLAALEENPDNGLSYEEVKKRRGWK